MFRFTRASDSNPRLICENDAKLIVAILNRDLGGAENYACEVPELYQDDEDLKNGEKIDENIFKAHQRLMVADYFERVFGRKVSNREYEEIRRVLNGFQ